MCRLLDLVLTDDQVIRFYIRNTLDAAAPDCLVTDGFMWSVSVCACVRAPVKIHPAAAN